MQSVNSVVEARVAMSRVDDGDSKRRRRLLLLVSSCVGFSVHGDYVELCHLLFGGRATISFLSVDPGADGDLSSCPLLILLW